MGYTRKPNFDKDNELGKIGEAFAYKVLSNSPKTVKAEDVSGEYMFRIIDVDFIQYLKKKEDGEEYTKEDVFYNIMGKEADRTFYNLYEIKTDTVSLESRNVVFEIISHDGVGCAASSRANYFFYIFVDKNLDIREAWLIDMRKWRECIRKNCKNVVPMTETKNGGIALNDFNKYGDRVMNILTNIEYLQKEKIATKIDIEKYA